jgi:hypothetical protein
MATISPHKEAITQDSNHSTRNTRYCLEPICHHLICYFDYQKFCSGEDKNRAKSSTTVYVSGLLDNAFVSTAMHQLNSFP